MDVGTPQRSRIGSFSAQRRSRSDMPPQFRTSNQVSSSRTGGNEQRHKFWQTVLNPHPSSPSAPFTLPPSAPPPTLSSPSPSASAPRGPGGSQYARRHVCFCGQVFTQRSHLNSHMRTVHEGRKPHTCELCNRSFGKRFDLNSHVAAVHNNERPYRCRFCDKAFAKKSNVVRHEQKIHSAT